jgi:hypothetical protein
MDGYDDVGISKFFKTLSPMHSKELKPVHITLDPMVVEPHAQI